MEIKPKLLECFSYKGHMIEIYGEYLHSPHHGIVIDNKIHDHVVVITYNIYKNETKVSSGHPRHSVLNNRLDNYIAQNTIKKTGKWYNRKKELVHIYDDLNIKLINIKERTKKMVNLLLGEDGYNYDLKKINDNLPNSLLELK